MAKACQASQNARVGLTELFAFVLKQQLPKHNTIHISDQWDDEGYLRIRFLMLLEMHMLHYKYTRN